MPSSRHVQLRRRCVDLKRHLLPKSPSLTGKYSKRQLDLIAGYFVLVHAEIESYFEDCIVALIDFAEDRWRTAHRVTRPLLGLVAYLEGNRAGPPNVFDENQFKDRSIEQIVGKSIGAHRGRVKNNNGIKEDDLCHLLFPVGFSHSDLSTTLVASLDSFGKRRGDFAHKSLHPVTQIQIDPFVEARLVEDIIEELKSFDTLVKSMQK